jgi:hypothetical protein
MIPSCLYLIFYIFRYDDDDDDDVGKLIPGSFEDERSKPNLFYPYFTPPSDFGVGCFRG